MAAQQATRSRGQNEVKQPEARQPEHNLDAGELIRVLTAVKNGDFSLRLPIDQVGLTGKVYDTLNDFIEMNKRVVTEIERIGVVVGTEGRLSQRASISGATGAWARKMEAINAMIADLVQPITKMARVITSVANGNLSQRMPMEIDGKSLAGEFRQTALTVNAMVEQLGTFGAEVTRVAREVGSEGKLGGQASVQGVAGVWKELTDGVNMMSGNLTGQVRNIAEVASAIVNGDLSKKITVDARGEILDLKDTINTTVDQLSAFASEVTRVAREVGSEGKLGGQASVQGVAGIWKDLTDNVNAMAGNLTVQLRDVSKVASAIANGDLSQKITVDVRGEILLLKDTINATVEQLRAFASEVTRVAREVGTEGKLGGQAYVPGVGGTWKDLTDSVNMMASNLTAQVRNIAGVATAIANGNLSKKITVDVKGEILDLKDTINATVEQLRAFASEVTRVAREVGTEGKLGGQAEVQGVAGIWKDLTDNVNSMGGNLTEQVRGIAKVVSAVAAGNLHRKLTVEARGEMADLAETINSMIDTLAVFAEQVTSVAREVGVEGKLGAQANVPGATGTWRDLVDNVNRLAANLTTQVRAIAEVATVVTKGDLSRSITVETAGEVAALKDNINEMIGNLRDTTRINTEQDWLKTNLARFTRLLQGQRDLGTVAQLVLSELAPIARVQHAVFYLNEPLYNEPLFKLFASYGYRERKQIASQFQLRQGLVGQAAFERQRILLTEVPGDYIKVNSGLGEITPLNLVLLPVVFEKEVLAVIELASISRFSDIHLSFFDQLTDSLGIVLNTIAATSRTESLLIQSQSMAGELQSRQEELQRTNERLEQQAQTLQESEGRLKVQQETLQNTNEELAEKADLLIEQNREVEAKNQEVELARRELEDKAEQLALTSKYKSEFLANMSHELRTPLNSIMILSRMLADNPDAVLTAKQVEYASTIHDSGSELLTLINDILDLSKIESGTVTVDSTPVRLTDLASAVERAFRAVADDKGLEFTVDLDPRLPNVIYTDETRLQQVLKNLLGNAFKFTSRGSVGLRIEVAQAGWTRDHQFLNRARSVIAFVVRDTGIGIPADKRQLIFEAFQQADSGSSRTYGGTGLGLSISREISVLLNGELCLVQSTPGQGSTFALYLPERFEPHANAPRRAEQPPVQSSQESVAPGSPAPALQAPAPQASTSTAFAPPASPTLTLPRQPQVTDDSAQLQPGERVLLVVEDDVRFASLLGDLAHAHGLKIVTATSGEQGLTLLQRQQPTALILDVKLPDMNGYVLLDRVKRDPRLCHIPVYVVTITDDRQRSRALGACMHLQKPVTQEDMERMFTSIGQIVDQAVKTLLVVAEDANQRDSIMALLANDTTRITAVATGAAALEALRGGHCDGVVLDLLVPDMPGTDVIDAMQRDFGSATPPIIVYTAKTLDAEEVALLHQKSETVLIKDAHAPEQLVTTTMRVLHQRLADLSPSAQALTRQQRLSDPTLAGKKVLIVDDDVRNIFALTSALQQYHMDVVYAENGRDGIARLQQSPSAVDVVLMDIMMPAMDGYEAMRTIRQMPQFQALPIIALTARAMRGDRERCLEAGASDYIAKPVEIEQLRSLLRVWLSR